MWQELPQGSIYLNERRLVCRGVSTHYCSYKTSLAQHVFVAGEGMERKKQSWEQGSSSNRAIPDPPAPPPHPIMPNRIDRAATTADNKIEQTWEKGKHKFSDVLFMTSSSFFLQMCEKQAVGHIDSQALSVCTLKCHVLLDLAYIMYFLTGLRHFLNLCVPCMYRV